MIRLDTFTLFLTWRCNFACHHCGFSCGPERSERLPLQRALDIIATVQRNPDLKMIAFSGGEPFLLYSDLLRCMKSAWERGSVGGVVTNCYWANTARVAERRLAELAAAGLREIIVSWDDYHMEFAGAENIQRVIQAALSCSVRVGVNILVTRAARVRKDDVARLVGVPDRILEDPKVIWFRESSPVRTGRAQRFVEAEDLEVFGEEVLLGQCCPYTVRNIAITPDEQLYACCGFGDTSTEGPASLAYLGSWRDAPFDEVFSRASRNLLFNLIYAAGPYRLLKLVEESQPSVRFRKRYASNCDVCREIASNRKVRKAVAGILRDMANAPSAYVEEVV